MHSIFPKCQSSNRELGIMQNTQMLVLFCFFFFLLSLVFGLQGNAAFRLRHPPLRDIDRVPRVQRRGTEMIKALGNKTYAGRSGQVGMFCLDKRRLGGNITV